MWHEKWSRILIKQINNSSSLEKLGRELESDGKISHDVRRGEEAFPLLQAAMGGGCEVSESPWARRAQILVGRTKWETSGPSNTQEVVKLMELMSQKKVDGQRTKRKLGAEQGK